LLKCDLDAPVTSMVWEYGKQVEKKGVGYALWHARVTDGKGGVGEGSKLEKASDFPDFVEKAETGAIGRALGALGFGTQFSPDLEEGIRRLVDAPVERSNAEVNGDNRRPQGNAQTTSNSQATNRQQGTNTAQAAASANTQPKPEKPIRSRPVPTQAQLKTEVEEMKIISTQGNLVTWPMVVAKAIGKSVPATTSMLGKRTLTMDECEKIDDLVERERVARRQKAEQAAQQTA
jgi:hypothetical protein